MAVGGGNGTKSGRNSDFGTFEVISRQHFIQDPSGDIVLHTPQMRTNAEIFLCVRIKSSHFSHFMDRPAAANTFTPAHPPTGSIKYNIAASTSATEASSPITSTRRSVAVELGAACAWHPHRRSMSHSNSDSTTATATCRPSVSAARPGRTEAHTVAAVSSVSGTIYRMSCFFLIGHTLLSHLRQGQGQGRAGQVRVCVINCDSPLLRLGSPDLRG